MSAYGTVPSATLCAPTLAHNKSRIIKSLGFAIWIDHHEQVIWAQGTHEYRPMGTAVIALRGQFRHRDFRQSLNRPSSISKQFAGFFGSLEEVNHYVGDHSHKRRLRNTPAHLL